MLFTQLLNEICTALIVTLLQVFEFQNEQRITVRAVDISETSLGTVRVCGSSFLTGFFILIHTSLPVGCKEPGSRGRGLLTYPELFPRVFFFLFFFSGLLNAAGSWTLGILDPLGAARAPPRPAPWRVQLSPPWLLCRARVALNGRPPGEDVAVRRGALSPANLPAPRGVAALARALVLGSVTGMA